MSCLSSEYKLYVSDPRSVESCFSARSTEWGPGNVPGVTRPRGTAQLFPQLADLPQLPARSKGSGEARERHGGGAASHLAGGVGRHIQPGLKPRTAPPPFPLNPWLLSHPGTSGPVLGGSKQLHMSCCHHPFLHRTGSPSLHSPWTSTAVWGVSGGDVEPFLAGTQLFFSGRLSRSGALSAGMATTHMLQRHTAQAPTSAFPFGVSKVCTVGTNPLKLY